MSSLRSLKSSTSIFTGFPVIDQLLNIFQDLGGKATNSLTPPVLEITSTSHCSGKTQLLYLIIAKALLPQSYHEIQLNGKFSAVILFGLSTKFSILRLREVIKSYINSCVSASNSAELSHADISTLVQASLLHLHVFRPQSSSSLLKTISSLPSYFLVEPATHLSSGRKIISLILNDLSAFLWQDRLADADITIANERSSGDSHLIQYYRLLISSLKAIQSTFSCLVIATNTSLSTPYYISGGHHALHRQTPRVWNNFCAIQIVIEQANIPKFGPGISAQEAEDERAKRQEAVRRGERKGWINRWDSEGWREEVKEDLLKWEYEWKSLKFSIGKEVKIGIHE